MGGNSHKQLLTPLQEKQVRARIEKIPNTAQPRVRLALHCWRSGVLPEAIEWIDSCLELEPANVDFYRIRANIFVDMKQSGRAVEVAIRAIELAPEVVMARLLMVRMLLADLQPDRAQRELNATLDLELEMEKQHLHFMKSLQTQILHMNQEAERDPIKWLSRKFSKRRANVASEDQKPA